MPFFQKVRRTKSKLAPLYVYTIGHILHFFMKMLIRHSLLNKKCDLVRPPFSRNKYLFLIKFLRSSRFKFRANTDKKYNNCQKKVISGKLLHLELPKNSYVEWTRKSKFGEII